MTLYIAGCNGIYLHAIIKEGHTALSIDPHLGYILNPIPLLEGIRIQEGSLYALFYTFGTPSRGIISVVAFIKGFWAPLFGAVPSLWLKCESVLDAFTNGKSQMEWSKMLQW